MPATLDRPKTKAPAHVNDDPAVAAATATLDELKAKLREVEQRLEQLRTRPKDKNTAASDAMEALLANPSAPLPSVTDLASEINQSERHSEVLRQAIESQDQTVLAARARAAALVHAETEGELVEHALAIESAVAELAKAQRGLENYKDRMTARGAPLGTDKWGGLISCARVARLFRLPPSGQAAHAYEQHLRQGARTCPAIARDVDALLSDLED